MKKTLKTPTLFGFLFVSIFLLAGCNKGQITKFNQPNIKDEYCGVVMNFQYCKCAFHNEYCDSVGLSSSAADDYVKEEYNKWLEIKKEEFKQSCLSTNGIWHEPDECEHCKEPAYKQGDKCVSSEDKNEEVVKDSFQPDGPFDADCNLISSQFDSDWKKYSDFDDNIEFASRSWEVQENLNTYEKIISLKVRNFELERDMEIDRQSRLALREYKQALVKNIKTNLLKSFWRLSYVTYSTIKSASGVGNSYSTVLTSTETLPVITNGLKVVQALVPSDSKLAIDTTTVSGKVKSIGLNAALEAFDSMGDPIKVATQVFNDAGNAPLPSADISPEEIAILRDQHLTNKLLDEVLAKSYRTNAIRRMELLDNQKLISLLEAEASSWEGKEKARVKALLEADCQKQKNDFENKDISLLNLFIYKANAQDNSIYTFGDYKVNYTEEKINENGDINYYQNDKLILSVYDTDNNDQADLWIQYDEDLYVILEAYDTTNDGQPDTIVELNREEAVSNLIQPKLEILEEYTNISDEVEAEKNYLPDKTENKSDNYKIVLAVIFIIILGYFSYSKKKQDK